ncbi:hypothetical protein A2334_01430 [Candidatus Roizmanbacteria bacterium RIFOXYB2_FULL_38_10]|uniref:Uncharacterized protein n=1 Tax=Candidatus Roizmanbacteria bacterium RIFOXYD1_FULL_38_12 TaxID=1802093 RepID=A0A1F7L280_9BACT|nr:MAG: hypothetical protein A3K47_05630 [Candidatus Roizmanbacteria bacterium RIFOXYA2_FULL_38_14]OGK64224.1 MAG: hypothetical protein A3K27_05630 [Candidatus Roizmanbacteria bacterium RIFOXYA1_FULL_37_12]OGK66070.1 MAG: hypothetical protein A3K38_05630 [Candidatus Roizmanbacteria bacterium RIFOXYB1_FULL_40_23]OGK68511.1 MAG: hypothetical protein A2334_01430 [Candidatus Roizmanbacteria bacterium RIFOXYB2_FULL_38_10]OGK70475.1 MAG: hypothetical protein A3K21_05635 [Candidatus Roizmanbacteria ba
MKNKTILFIASIFYILVLSLNIPPVKAETIQGIDMKCLTGIYCDSDGADCQGPGVKYHREKISLKTGDTVPDGKETYIILCLSDLKPAPDGTRTMCTTGNSAKDIAFFNQDNLSDIKNRVNGYDFEKIEDLDPDPPTRYGNTKIRHGLWTEDGSTRKCSESDCSGEPIIASGGTIGVWQWEDFIPTNSGQDAEGNEKTPTHMWYRAYETDPQPTQIPGAGPGIDASQKLGGLDFEKLVLAPDSADCVSISWDPEGRIFDAQTLEPIKGARVELHVKQKDGLYRFMTRDDFVNLNFINPQITSADGAFTYLVPDGDYKLIMYPPNGYSFPTETSYVNPAYLQAYWNLYPSQTGVEIIQRGKIQHRDIPLFSATRKEIRDPILMGTTTRSNGIDGSLIVEGTVSHPLTKVIAHSYKVGKDNPNSKISYRPVGSVQADKIGKFKLIINQNDFAQDEFFGELELSKYNYQTKSFSIVNAKKQSFEPLPTYLEGYAYDESGKIIPNAKIEIHVGFSKQPYTWTTADDKGYFKIEKQYLPNIPYEIQYKSSNGSVVTSTTSKFITQNQSFITSNKISLYGEAPSSNRTKKQSETAGKDLTSLNLQKSGSGNNMSSQSQKNIASFNPSKSNANPLILIFILLIILLSGVAMGILLYMKNKQSYTSKW